MILITVEISTLISTFLNHNVLLLDGNECAVLRSAGRLPGHRAPAARRRRRYRRSQHGNTTSILYDQYQL